MNMKILKLQKCILEILKKNNFINFNLGDLY